MSGKQAKKQRRQEQNMGQMMDSPVGITLDALIQSQEYFYDMSKAITDKEVLEAGHEVEAALSEFCRYLEVLDFDYSTKYGQSMEPLFLTMDTISSKSRNVILNTFKFWLDTEGESISSITIPELAKTRLLSLEEKSSVYNQLYDLYCLPILGKGTYRAFMDYLVKESLETARFALATETENLKKKPDDKEAYEWAKTYLSATENLRRTVPELKSDPDSLEYMTELYNKLDATGKDFFLNEHLFGIIQIYEDELGGGEITPEHKKYLYLARRIYTELADLKEKEEK